MARPSIANVSSNPAQGQVLCNTVVQAAGANSSTVYCGKEMYHEGRHQATPGLSQGWPKSIYNTV